MERANIGPRLILVCGLPGTGKTTFAQRIETKVDAVRFSPDEWMAALSLELWDEAARAKVEALQWTLARRLLTLGMTVIIEWGTWARHERDTLRMEARKLGATVELHCLALPMDVLFERVQRRGCEGPPITLEHISRWFTAFEIPTPEEMALFDMPHTVEP